MSWASEDTLRRDLRGLAQEGLLLRVHGGALSASPAIADFAAREDIRYEGRVAIGRFAAAMVQHGQVVILDGGQLQERSPAIRPNSSKSPS